MSVSGSKCARTARTPFGVKHLGAALALTASAFAAGMGTQTFAAEHHHRQLIAVPRAALAGVVAERASVPPPRLVSLQATMTQVYPTIGANADGFDLWPCFGFSPSGNPDCPTVGDPTIQLPTGGVVLGFPSYVWQLASNSRNADGIGCDALLNGTTGVAPAQYRPCGQIATWYEDETGDSTDDLLQRIVVTQGGRTIYDSGTVDYGPAGPSVSYPVDVILSTDANFGFWPGAALGPNNGNCSADTNYPLTSPAWPQKVYAVAGGQTCEEPVSGVARFTTWTSLATPQYVQLQGSACTSKGVASPCYVVRWTRRYEIHQDFDIFLE
jgi:hypothetical protein